MIRRLVLYFIAMVLAGTAFAQPAFKGGSSALNTFLDGHIIYPEYSRQNCISGTIQVAFKVDHTGRVFDVTVKKGMGIDLDDEAVRVVKMTTGKWDIPAGNQGISALILPIRFKPDLTRCGRRTEQDVTSAINAYRARQELENAVTNYYENKYLGKADLSKEPQIIALKKQLGFDDALIDDVLEQAQTKLKQGDRDGACTDWKFIRNIGSSRADDLIGRYCK